MIKGIGKNITKKEEKNVLDETRDFYMKLNESEADSKYDCDMSPVERLASEGVTYVAERIAKGFVDAVDDMSIESTKLLVCGLQAATPKEAAGMLQGLFFAKDMRSEAWLLGALSIFGKHYEAAYDDFIDYFFQTDEMDWFIVENLLDELTDQDSCKVIKWRCIDGKDDCGV